MKITTNKALDIAVSFWVEEVRKLKKNVSDTQIETFTSELRNNLGNPRKFYQSELDGGVVGYDFEDYQVVPNALKAANIKCIFHNTISVQIVPWYKKPEKRTVYVYRDGNRESLGDVVEEFEDE